MEGGPGFIGGGNGDFSYSPRIAAEPFVPHAFQVRQEFLKRFIEPKIFITPEAFADMLAIAENSGLDEVGWLGTVTKLGGGQYLIDGVHMPAQSVNGGTCELTEDGIGEFFTELATTNFDACSRMFFWGHVHPGNSTNPSPQDEKQMDKFAYNDWFIRGIFGRHGRAEFTFFDYENGIRWNDVPWAIYCPVAEERRKKWAAEVAAKVKKIQIQPVYGGEHSFFANGPSQADISGKGLKGLCKKIRTLKKGGENGGGWGTGNR